MFRTAHTKLPILFLALVACLVTVYQPVLVYSVVTSQSTESESESGSKSKPNSESESETEKLLEAKSFCQRTFSSRRLRQAQHQSPLHAPMAMDELREIPNLSEFNTFPKSVYLVSPSPLRAPPA